MEHKIAENNSECKDSVMDDSKKSLSSIENIEDFVQHGFKCLVSATKSSNRLPFGRARDIYESYPVFHSLMNKSAEKVLSELSKLIKHAGFRSNIHRRDDDEKIEMIIDINDGLLGKVGKILDEISGISKYPEAKLLTNSPQAVSGSWNIKSKGSQLTAIQVLNEIFERTKNIEKPQLNFKDVVNNDRNSVFEPKIKYKYNLLKPLAITEEIDESGNIHFCHPYQFELEHFKPSEEQLLGVQPSLYASMADTPFHFITTTDEIKSLISDCKKYKEIGVDLEHHSYRSFEGFTCLLQISTRDTDYIIDAIVLRNELEELNEIFTDPKIVKIFHGADNDLLWLQRDLGVYVVNLFDTFEAAKFLNYPRHSLAYLLLKFCGVTPEKHFQLADWRVRPLPEALMDYARGDTHYLLYIYDNLKNILIEKGDGKSNYLESVISTCTTKCLKQVYEKPPWSEDGYLTLYHRSKKLFDNRQKHALKCLFEWRDHIARTHDESYGYVLPNHMMLQISETLPREAQGILACCNPVPVLVRKYLLPLHQIILKARDQPLVGPVFEERQFHRLTDENNLVPNNHLNCPHDLNHEAEFRDDLPVLLSNNSVMIDRDECLVNCNPIINVFEENKARRRRNIFSVKESAMLTPFQRYKLAKPFSEKKDIDAQKAMVSTEEKVQMMEVNTVDFSIKKEPAEKEKITEEKSLKRRRAEEKNSIPSKKIKVEKVNLVKNPYYKDRDSGQDPAPRAKRERPGGAEIEPFNYSSVNYDKFQTHIKPDSKRNKRRRRHKRTGKEKS